jgi:hypothetical protein
MRSRNRKSYLYPLSYLLTLVYYTHRLTEVVAEVKECKEEEGFGLVCYLRFFF